MKPVQPKTPGRRSLNAERAKSKRLRKRKSRQNEKVKKPLRKPRHALRLLLSPKPPERKKLVKRLKRNERRKLLAALKQDVRRKQKEKDNEKPELKLPVNEKRKKMLFVKLEKRKMPPKQSARSIRNTSK